MRGQRPPTVEADEGHGRPGRARRVVHLTPGQRAEKGRAARQEVPRRSHGEWQPAPDRPDPIALLEELGHGDTFDRAMAAFAEQYADQNERDYAELEAAVASGRVTARPGV